MGRFANPALGAAKALLAEGALPSDTLGMIGGCCTFIPTPLDRLVAPRAPHPPLRWREGKQHWNGAPQDE